LQARSNSLYIFNFRKMKKFISTSIIFLTLLVTPIYFYLSIANGYTDQAYLKFTSPKQSSFIIGNSRSAQGIAPEIINKYLNRNDVYNYSFNQTVSSYGPYYLRSIQRKLKNDTKNGIYIITVDPWSIGGTKEEQFDTLKFREKNSYVDNMRFVSLNPNIPYLLKNYSRRFINLYRESKYNNNLILHDDGWLEVNIDMHPDTLEKRMEAKVKSYREDKVPYFKYSQIRFDFLEQTINFLKMHGKVYVVRLPMHNKILNLENKVMPNFNNLIAKLTVETNVPYFDMTPYNTVYSYTDGNHICKESAYNVSHKISDWIKSVEP